MTEERHEGYKFGLLRGDFWLCQFYNSHQKVLKSDSYDIPIDYKTNYYTEYSSRIVNFNRISGLSLEDLKEYKDIVYKDTLVFIIYDEIDNVDSTVARIRFSLTIGEEVFKNQSEDLIDDVIAERLAKIPLINLKKSDQQRIKEFLSQYGKIDYVPKNDTKEIYKKINQLPEHLKILIMEEGM